LRINQKKFADLHRYLRNFLIRDCGLSPRICGFLKKLCGHLCKFVTKVNDTGGKLSPNNTGGKFATSVNGGAP
jgi:hypothetical protein